jgi:hypothetical protein
MLHGCWRGLNRHCLIVARFNPYRLAASVLTADFKLTVTFTIELSFVVTLLRWDSHYRWRGPFTCRLADKPLHHLVEQQYGGCRSPRPEPWHLYVFTIADTCSCEQLFLSAITYRSA